MESRTRSFPSQPSVQLSAILLLVLATFSCATKEEPPPPPPAPTITAVSVSPATATVDVGATQQFAATVQGTGNFSPAVRWLVNDVEGGNSTLGTITSTGLYTGPANLPVPNAVTVKAVSVADSSKSGSAAVTLADIPFRPEGKFQEVEDIEDVEFEGQIVPVARDQVLVFTEPDITREQVDGLKAEISRLGGVIIGSMADLRIVQVRVSSAASEVFVINQLQDIEGVRSAGLNLLVTTSQDNQRGYQKYLQRKRTATIPEPTKAAVELSPEFGAKQFYWIDHLRLREAWDRTTGSADAEANATIGIIDTGVDLNPRFMDAARLQRYKGDGESLAGVEDDTRDAEDGHHGRWVTAFAAAFSDGASTLSRGVALKNRVVFIDVMGLGKEECIDLWLFKVFCSRPIFVTNLAEAVRTSIHRGARVVNISWGPGGIMRCSCDFDTGKVLKKDNSPKIRSFYGLFWTGFINVAEYAASEGALLVFGSGNACEKGMEEILPKERNEALSHLLTNTIRVAATTSTKADACFSNMGPPSVDRETPSPIEIAAPGQEIGFWAGSGFPTSYEAERNMQFGSGTSYAAPLVTGAAALLRSILPSLSPPELKHILISTADSLPHVAYEPKKLMNVHKAVLDAEALRRVDFATIPRDGEISLSFGEEKRVQFDIEVPFSTASSMDVVFLIDRSGSYGDDIAELQLKANQILDNISARGADVQFGVASFADFPFWPYGNQLCGDQAFFLNQPITNNLDAVRFAIDRLDQPLHCGADGPESQLEALYQAATGEGRDLNGNGRYDDLGDILPTNIGWRTGALRIIILATDAPFHDPSREPSYPCFGCRAATFEETLHALKNRGITVIGLDSGFTAGDLLRVVNETGGTLHVLTGSNLVEAVAAAIAAKLRRIDLTLRFVAGREEHNMWIHEHEPAGSVTAFPGQRVTYTLTLRGIKQRGVVSQRYNIYLWVMGDNSAVLKRVHIPIRVPPKDAFGGLAIKGAP